MEAFKGGTVLETEPTGQPVSDQSLHSDESGFDESKHFQDRVDAAQRHASSLISLIRALRADKRKLLQIARQKEQVIEELKRERTGSLPTEPASCTSQAGCSNENMVWTEEEVQQMRGSLVEKIIREQELVMAIKENEEVIADLNERLNAVREIEHKMVVKYNELEINNTLLNNKNELMERNLQEGHKQNAELQDEIKNLQATKETFAKRIEELHSTLVHREKLFDAATEEMKGIISKCEALQENNTCLVDSIKIHKEAAENAQGKVLSNSSKITELANLLTAKDLQLAASIQESKQTLDKSILEKVAIITELQNKVQTLADANLREAEEKNLTTLKHDHLLVEYNKLKQQELTLATENQQLKHELANGFVVLEQRVREAEKLNQELIDDKRKYSEERVHLENDVARLGKLNSSLLIDCELLKQSTRQSFAEICRQKAEHAELLEISNKLRLRCEEVAIEREKACADNAAAQAENKRFNKLIGDLQSQREQLSQQRETERMKSQQLEITNTHLKTENHHLAEEKKDLAAYKEQLLHENDELRRLLEESQLSKVGLKENIVRIVDEYEKERQRQEQKRLVHVKGVPTKTTHPATYEIDEQLIFHQKSRQAECNMPLAMSDMAKLLDDYQHAETIYARTTSSHLLRSIRSMQRTARQQGKRESQEVEEQQAVPNSTKSRGIKDEDLDMTASFKLNIDCNAAL